jgi:RNA polymerase sigma-70 factor (ECF subfamily)
MEYSEQRLDSLVARLREGNRAAAAELVDIYYRQIYVFFRRLGHGPQASEDLTQESFMAAWQHIGQLRNGRALNSGMYRIASNASKLYWRKHKNETAVSINQFDMLEPADGVDYEKTGNYDQLVRLADAMAKLPAKLRQAVVLHYMQHLTIADAALIAGVRQGTFKSRLNRALKFLRNRIATEGQSKL